MEPEPGGPRRRRVIPPLAETFPDVLQPAEPEPVTAALLPQVKVTLPLEVDTAAGTGPRGASSVVRGRRSPGRSWTVT